MPTFSSGFPTPESRDFNCTQLSPLADLQIFVVQLADPNSSQLHHRMSDRIKHLSYLLIAAFMKHDFEPGVRFALAYFANLGRRSTCAFVDSYPATQSVNRSV